jgi:hypothetical protein
MRIAAVLAVRALLLLLLAAAPIAAREADEYRATVEQTATPSRTGNPMLKRIARAIGRLVGGVRGSRPSLRPPPPARPTTRAHSRLKPACVPVGVSRRATRGLATRGGMLPC